MLIENKENLLLAYMGYPLRFEPATVKNKKQSLESTWVINGMLVG
jgi:hypothetical protein